MFDCFIQNEFTNQYKTLINAALNRNYNPSLIYEEHHIIPKSLGGGNSTDNLVNLTVPEHIEAHRLLVFMTCGVNKAKLSYAYWMMVNVENEHQTRKITLTPNQIEEAKKIRAEVVTTAHTRELIAASRKGKIAIYNEELNRMKYIDRADFYLFEPLGFRLGSKPKTELHKKRISETNIKKGIVPKSIGWNSGLNKNTDSRLAKISQKMQGNVPWNKGKSGTGFGDMSINPMKNPEKVKKMLETRKKNKEARDDN